MSRPARPRRPASDLLCFVSYLSCRNLDVDSGIPFLVSALSIFLIANISMISASRQKDRPKKASKKSLTQFEPSCEPKSDAKLLPPSKPTKYFGKKISKITLINNLMVIFGHFCPILAFSAMLRRAQNEGRFQHKGAARDEPLLYYIFILSQIIRTARADEDPHRDGEAANRHLPNRCHRWRARWDHPAGWARQ